MEQRMKKRGRGWKITLLVIAAVLLLGSGTFLIYVSIYYHADETAAAAMVSDEQVTVSDEKGRLVFAPAQAETGLIFYPGGKVEESAYAPLMHRLAERNILCVVMKMPFRLAVFNVNAADGVQADYPQIRRWFIGGHSLGGSMAASYLSSHEAAFEGLILLAAYSTADLSHSGLRVLSLYGSEDGVLNRETYRDSLKNLPASFKELVIPGGCHAWFGSYGKQPGDGEPAITPEQQWQQTVEFIAGQLEVGGPSPTSFLLQKTTAEKSSAVVDFLMAIESFQPDVKSRPVWQPVAAFPFGSRHRCFPCLSTPCFAG